MRLTHGLRNQNEIKNTVIMTLYFKITAWNKEYTRLSFFLPFMMAAGELKCITSAEPGN